MNRLTGWKKVQQHQDVRECKMPFFSHAERVTAVIPSRPAGGLRLVLVAGRDAGCVTLSTATSVLAPHPCINTHEWVAA